MAVSQHFIAWRCDEKRLHNEYLYQWLQLEKTEFERIATGSTVKTIGLGYFQKLRLPVPSIDVQRDIASALDTWDAAIHTTDQLITAKEHILAALRQRLFARDVRKGFVRVRLDSIFKERQENSDGQSPVYSVSVRKGLVNQIEHLGRSFSAATTDHYSMVRPGDIVYTKSPTGDFPFGIVKQSRAHEDSIVSPLYGVFIPQRREIGTVIDFFFESPANARNYLRPLVQKGAKNTLSISNDQFLQGVVTLPDESSAINRIANLIDEARHELSLLQSRLRLLKEQKQGLMQKLLTGQWRLSGHGATEETENA